MWVECWADVVDGGPLIQHWVNIFQQTRNVHPNVGTMLAHRLRRWPNIVPTLGERLVFAEM